MKALVYIVCVAVAAMVQTAISMSGVQLGGLPVVLLYGTALAVATAACKANDGTPARSVGSSSRRESRVTAKVFLPSRGRSCAAHRSSRRARPRPELKPNSRSRESGLRWFRFA